MATNHPELENELALQQQVKDELSEMEQLTRQFNADEVKSGDWFLRLLMLVIGSYERNARAAYFQKKYPGVSPDDIADTLISVTVRYAAIAGGISGVSATASQIASIASAGMTLPVFVGVIGAEMLYLARIQMRLILDLAVVYDLGLDPDDPEDILMVWGYALGVAPTEAFGTALVKVVAPTVTRNTIRSYISKGTLEAVQQFGRSIGVKILQRTIIQYSIPVVSAAVGAGYNYATTRSIGAIAKAHFRQRDLAADELRDMLSRRHTYDLVFPAAIMYMAQIDGAISSEEMALYRSIVSRISIEEHEQEEFHQLLKADETTLLHFMGSIENREMRRSLIDALGLIAVYDGDFADAERAFLERAATQLGISVDLEALRRQAAAYGHIEPGIVGRSSQTLAKTADRVTSAARETTQKIGRSTQGMGKRIRGLSSHLPGRKTLDEPAADTDEEPPSSENP